MVHYRNCIVFVAVILGIGALITAFFGGSPAALVIVAIAVFFASLAISKTNPLNGEAVDRTYYTSAMLGACLFFYAQSVERTEFLGYSVTIATAAAVLSGDFSMAERINALEKAQTVLNQKIDDVRSKSSEITNEIEKEKEQSASTIGQIALFIWPYVLIALLGLKLSRAPRKNSPQIV